MAVTKRYAVYCHGELIGEYTAVDAADMLKCTPGTVRTYASGGNKLYGEYTFEAVEPGEKAVKPWSKCDETGARMEVMQRNESRWILFPENDDGIGIIFNDILSRVQRDKTRKS